jgi:hypothetical protein
MLPSIACLDTLLRPRLNMLLGPTVVLPRPAHTPYAAGANRRPAMLTCYAWFPASVLLLVSQAP